MRALAYWHGYSLAMPRLLLIMMSFALGACSSAQTEPDGAGPGAGKEGTFKEIAYTPLSDLNLVRAKIPPVLLAARTSPYALPRKTDCQILEAEIRALDHVLGADLDAPPDEDDPGLLERGANLAGDAAVGAVRGAAEGIVPFRSWVRKLTGAERHSKEVAAAIAAGGVRRAFLKGLGQAAGCKPPSSPLKAVAETGKDIPDQP